MFSHSSWSVSIFDCSLLLVQLRVLSGSRGYWVVGGVEAGGLSFDEGFDFSGAWIGRVEVLEFAIVLVIAGGDEAELFFAGVILIDAEGLRVDIQQIRTPGLWGGLSGHDKDTRAAGDGGLLGKGGGRSGVAVEEGEKNGGEEEGVGPEGNGEGAAGTGSFHSVDVLRGQTFFARLGDYSEKRWGAASCWKVRVRPRKKWGKIE